jgi:hypothetical protein
MAARGDEVDLVAPLGQRVGELGRVVQQAAAGGGFDDRKSHLVEGAARALPASRMGVCP